MQSQALRMVVDSAQEKHSLFPSKGIARRNTSKWVTPVERVNLIYYRVSAADNLNYQIETWYRTEPTAGELRYLLISKTCILSPRLS